MRLLLSCICLIIINAVTSVHVSVCFLRIEGVSVILECKIVALYLDYLYALEYQSALGCLSCWDTKLQHIKMPQLADIVSVGGS